MTSEFLLCGYLLTSSSRGGTETIRPRVSDVDEFNRQPDSEIAPAAPEGQDHRLAILPCDQWCQFAGHRVEAVVADKKVDSDSGLGKGNSSGFPLHHRRLYFINGRGNQPVK